MGTKHGLGLWCKGVLVAVALVCAPGAWADDWPACRPQIYADPGHCGGCNGSGRGGTLVIGYRAEGFFCVPVLYRWNWFPCWHAYTGKSVAGNHTIKEARPDQTGRIQRIYRRYLNCQSGHGL